MQIVDAPNQRSGEKVQYPEQWINEFPRPLRELAFELSKPQTELPISTANFAESIPTRIRAGFIEYCIDNGFTFELLFARACALINWKELTKISQNWFTEKNITVSEGQDIQVSLRHSKDDGRFGQGGCHEVAQTVLYGEHQGQTITGFTPWEVTQISSYGFIAHNQSNKNPNGSMAEVNIWGRLRYTVVGSYVAGNGQNARGILVPAKDTYPAAVYWHTKNSYNKNGSRHFYLHPNNREPVNVAMSALSRHLAGDIPAVKHLFDRSEAYTMHPY